ncbi:NAD(P)/FAD-dependent oxidoreductase [Mycobacterium asiaticum]|uniref:NADH dehydrogenase n=1 Tax=Mycobacterium asiaticum TaxID=1790 RepID=A0A1A3N547_MYCAS|nr:FAD-dependent oxidoreductase [Mycobacterium asiaticum]OBK16184.1 NADH dehydrogenase [Mycobacterium asiaticum]
MDQQVDRAPSVVIVGSGFAGFTCARRLISLLRRRGSPATVTLISPLDYLLYTPLLPDVAGGAIDPRFIAIPLSDSLTGVRLIRGYVDAVDFRARTVSFRDQENTTQQLAWDRLVLTPGSVTRRFDIPGLDEYARGLKSIAEALYLRDHILEQFELATIDRCPRRARARKTVVVVGASYSGTELIAQLCAMTAAAARRFGSHFADTRLILLELSDRVMPEIGAKLATKAEHLLRRRGVEIRTGLTLNEVGADYAILTDGTRIDTHTVAWLTGVVASPLIARLGLPTERGRLTVGADLGVPDMPGVFAGGDAAAVADVTKPGRITPPTAQHATRQGRTLATNVAASLGHGKPRSYRHRDLGTVVDLGPGFAVANPLNVHLSGLAAKAVTRGYHLYAIPSPANRWAVLTAYLTAVVFPRPVVSLGVAPSSIARFSASEEFAPPADNAAE